MRRGPLIKVSPRHERIYKGVLYDSKTEMRRARYLDALICGNAVRWWIYKPPFRLGTDPVTIYRPDFLVMWTTGKVSVEDVKGYNAKTKRWHCTRAFTRAIKLWKRYGPLPLWITVWLGSSWSIEEEIPAAQLTGA